MFLLAVPGPPQSLEVVVLNATSFTVTWDEPLILNGVVEGYQLSYSLLAIDDYLNEVHLHIDLGPGSRSVVVSGLHPFASYWLELQARTDKGLGEATNVSAMTPEDGEFSRLLDTSIRGIIFCQYLCLSWYSSTSFYVSLSLSLYVSLFPTLPHSYSLCLRLSVCLCLCVSA